MVPEPTDDPEPPTAAADGADPLPDTELFRQAFRRHATTVAIVTYFDSADRPCGMTATSVASLSAAPPSLLVSIARGSRAHGEITSRGRFGVNLLSVAQRAVALHCSRVGMDKDLRPTWLVGGLAADATPRLVGALAHLECVVGSSYDVYSHSIFVGLIKRVWLNPIDGPALLYHGGAYGQLEPATEQRGRFLWEPLE
jgi:flavin reductase (DIM6/NTAB) family NADH-FMN oxidoreductase RutF